MVVLSAAILTKSGKPLVARQFVEMSRARIEGLLVAFPKLIATGQQHTFVETESVRYLYKPLEELYMVLVTTKSSNILEDLETLHLFSRVVPDYCHLDEEDVSAKCFELSFAFDEIVSLGYSEHVTPMQVRTYTDMESHEEAIQEMLARSKEQEAKEQAKLRSKQIEMQRKEAMKRAKMTGMGPSYPMGSGMGSGMGGGMGGGYGPSPTYAAPPSTYSPPSSSQQAPQERAAPLPAPSGRGMKLGGKKDSLLDTVKNEVGINLDLGVSADAGAGYGRAAAAPEPEEPLESVQLRLEEKVTVVANRDGGLENMEVKGDVFIKITDPSRATIRVQFANVDEKTHQYKTHPNVDKKLFSSNSVIGLKDPNRPFPVNQPLGVLKWRYVTKDEDAVPLHINCWPNPAGDGAFDINVEYELLRDDVVLEDVIITIPVSGQPAVHTVDGDYVHNRVKGVLEWRLHRIDDSNRTGTLEMTAPGPSVGSFFPVIVDYTSSHTYVGISVADVTLPSGESVPFSCFTQSIPEDYRIV